ncbi:SH3 domain-containing protein, partial [Candidatus Amarolinea dominans]|uniref:SH3 domain-containing protein n=1 Tax=Candidatus Amarolinea dominans TaxID=3140696 RepID=UPI0031360325|nr:SH3 domain-containing protein [Anaerolineae bacterium]
MLVLVTGCQGTPQPKTPASAPPAAPTRPPALANSTLTAPATATLSAHATPTVWMPTAAATTMPTAAAPIMPTAIPSVTPTPLARAWVRARANVRSGPDTTYPSLGMVEGGQIFDVRGQSADGVWMQVCCLGKPPAPGWMLVSLLNVVGARQHLPVVEALAP